MARRLGGSGAGGRCLVRREVVHDYVDGGVGTRGACRLQCRGVVVSGLAVPGHTPQLVVADGVAGVEVADAVGAVVGGRRPVRFLLLGPGGSVAGADRQGPELIEGEVPVQGMPGHVPDGVEFGVLVGVLGLLPGASALEGDPVFAQDLIQPFTADLDRSDPVAGQVVGEPARLQCVNGRPSLAGRILAVRDDELAFVADQPGTASLQRGHAVLVERVDRIADGVLIAATSRAIAVTGLPHADAMMIRARPTYRLVSARRTIRCRLCPSSSVNRLALTGSAIHDLTPNSDHTAVESNG